MDRRTNGQIGRQINRQIDRHTNRQINRQTITDRQTYKRVIEF